MPSEELKQKVPGYKLWRLFEAELVVVYTASIITFIAVLRYPQWHRNVLNLLACAWTVFVSEDIGSTTQGFINVAVEGVSTLVVGAIMIGYLFGFKKLKEYILETIIIAIFAASTVAAVLYGSQLAWEVAKVVHLDHKNMVAANGRLQSQLAEKLKPVAEPPNSLRRRTIKVTDDIVAFWDELGPQPFFNPTTDEQRQKDTEWSNKANRAYIAAGFKERISGIVQEYKLKGAPIGFLESEAEQQPQRMWGAFPERGCLPLYQSEVCQLRELAYHVDAHDELIVIKPD